jgi:hypothetical protein
MTDAALDKADWPVLFRPNLSPKDCIQKGIFGGSYFGRPDLISVEEFPKDWFRGLADRSYRATTSDAYYNRYKVAAGSSQAEWERSGWMHVDDPRGWFQWYCRYWLGRRHEDDERQINRWINFASVSRGRWTRQLYSSSFDRDLPFWQISPVIRQSLLHWGYESNMTDFRAYLATREKTS